MEKDLVLGILTGIFVVYIIGRTILFFRTIKYISAKRALGKMFFQAVLCAVSYFGLGTIISHINDIVFLTQIKLQLETAYKVLPVIFLMFALIYAVTATIKLIKEIKEGHHNNYNSEKEQNFNKELNYKEKRRMNDEGV